MKGMDHLRAAAAEAKARGKDGVEAARRRAQEANPEAYRRSEKVIRGSLEQQKALQDKLNEGYRAAGETTVGSATGGAVRRVGSVARQLPLLSAAADVMQEKNNVRVLAEQAAANPNDPLVHLWLGEAMVTMARDQLVFDAVRTAVNPMTAVVRESARALGGLGAGVNPVQHVLGRAHALSVLRLRTNKRDDVALHVVARVALAKNRPEEAVTPAKLAATASSGTDRGFAFATLSRAFLGIGDDTLARRAATAAVAAGCTLGWDTLAELLYRADEVVEEQADRSRYRQYVDTRSKVSSEDRRRYAGNNRDSSDVARSVLKLQGDKVKNGASQVKSGVGKLRPGDRRQVDPKPIIDLDALTSGPLGYRQQ